MTAAKTTPETQPETPAETHPAHEPDHPHSHSHAPAMNEQCRREVKVEVPADEVARAEEAVVSRYQKLARVPGFRSGKVPASVVRNRFADDVKGDVIEQLVPDHFRTEVRKAGLAPISQPHITDLHFHKGEPLRFTAVFEVMPEFEAKDYKKLKADKKDLTVTDAEVEESLKSIQDRQASFDAVDDRPLKEGDFASASLVGVAKGTKAIAEKKAELAAEKGEELAQSQAQPVELKDILIEIGGATTLKEFSENLRGAKPGDEKIFDVSYPEDFNDQRLAGQVMTYTVQVLGVKKKILPELNEEFVKELGDFKSVDDLRKKLRENLESERKHEHEHAEKEKLVDQLVAGNDFPVPEALIQDQIDVRLERGFRALAAQGMRQQDFKRLNLARLREAQKDSAIREVKAALLLEKIADAEKIEASDEDVQRELELVAIQTQQPVEALRDRLEKDGSLNRIKHRIRNEKALEFLYSQSA